MCRSQTCQEQERSIDSCYEVERWHRRHLYSHLLELEPTPELCYVFMKNDDRKAYGQACPDL